MRLLYFLFVLLSFSCEGQTVLVGAVPSDLDPTNYPEYPGEAVTKTSHTFASTIDPSLTAIKLRVGYVTAATNLPVLIVMTGYHDSSTSLDAAQDNMTRWARLGFFVVYVDTRGGNGSSGTYDDGGRETHDIYDAYNFVVANYSAQIALNKADILGYSRGGGMALLMASRYPDLFQCVIDYFGISNWGGDATYGWYEQEPSRQASLSTAIGGNPTALPDEYDARHSQSAVAQNFTGHIVILHDVDDASVQVDHSQQVVASFVSASKTNYTYSETDSGDADRWTHSYPGPANDLEASETLWLTHAKNRLPKVIASAGTLKVIGSVITKKFTLNLNDGDPMNNERSRVATLVYDVNAGTYQITNNGTDSLTAVVTDFTGATDSVTVASGATETITL